MSSPVYIKSSSLSLDFYTVDKVIIAQDHVERFINTLSPGAYRSLTKIDFKRMDHVHVKPLGVYGSKEEIVRFLRQLGTIDETT